MLAAIAAMFDEVDLLLTPTTATTAFVAEGPPPLEIAGQRVGGMGSVPYTAPFNISGQPAVSIPAGLSSEGLPVGLQVVARASRGGARARVRDCVAETQPARGPSSRRWPTRVALRAVTDVHRDGSPRARLARSKKQASEEVTEVAPGVLRMQLPIWMPGLGHVNMYGLVDDNGHCRRRSRPSRSAVVEGVEGAAQDRRLPRQGRPHRRRHALAPRPLRWRGPHRARSAREDRHAPRVLDVDREGPEPAARALRGRSAPARDRSRRGRAVASTSTPTSCRPIADDADVVHDDTDETRADVEPVGRDDAVGHDEPGSAAEAQDDDPRDADAVHAARADRPAAPRRAACGSPGATGSSCTRPATPSTTSARGIPRRARCSPATTCCRRSRRTSRACARPTR